MHDQAMPMNGPGATLVTDLEAWLPDALRLAMVRLGNRADAEDSVQDACRDALGAVGRMPPSSGIRKGWFMTIVINRCRMLKRSQRRRTHHEQRAEPGAPVVEDTTDHALLSDLIANALAELPERERRPIELRFLGGLDFREIAVALGRPEQTVRSQVDRGLERLRAILARQGTTTTAATCALTLAAIPPIQASMAWTPAGLTPSVATASMAPSTMVMLGAVAAAAVAIIVAVLALFPRNPVVAPLAVPPNVSTAAVAGVHGDPPPVAVSAVTIIGTGPFQTASSVRDLAISPDRQRIAWVGHGHFGWWTGATGSGPTIDRPGIVAVEWADDDHLLLLWRDLETRVATSLIIHAIADGSERELALPRQSDPYHLALTADRRFVAIACCFPGLPATGEKLGVAIIELPVLRISERIVSLPQPGSSEALSMMAFDPSGSRLALITNRFQPNDRGEGKFIRYLRIWDRDQARLLADEELPYQGLVSDISWTDATTIEWRHDRGEPHSLVTGRYRLESGSVDARAGWSWSLADGTQAVLDDQALALPNGAVIPMSGISNPSIAERDGLLAIGERHQARIIDLRRGQEFLRDDRTFPGIPDDLGWCGDALAVRFGDQVRFLAGDGSVIKASTGNLSQLNPFATGTGMVAVGLAWSDLRLMSASGGTSTLHAEAPWNLEWLGLQPGDARVAMAQSIMRYGFVHPDDAFAITVRSTSDLQQRVDLEQVTEFRSHVGDPASAWSPDGRHLYLGVSGRVGCWDLNTGTRLWLDALPSSNVEQCQLTLRPDGAELAVRQLIYNSDDTTLTPSFRLLDPRTGRVVTDLEDVGANPVWTRDGRRLVGSTSSILRPQTTRAPYRQDASDRWPSPDGRWLLTWSKQEGLHLDDSAGAGIHLTIDVPAAVGARPVRVVWHPRETWLALTYPYRPCAVVVKPFSGDLALPPADLIAALDDERWPAAVAQATRMHVDLIPLLDKRPRDARTVLAFAAMARGGNADATTRLKSLAEDGALGALAVLAADALAAVAPPPAIQPVEIPSVPTNGDANGF